MGEKGGESRGGEGRQEELDVAPKVSGLQDDKWIKSNLLCQSF